MPTTVSLQRKTILCSCHFHLLSLWLKTVQSSAVQPGSEKRALGEIWEGNNRQVFFTLLGPPRTNEPVACAKGR